MCGLALDLRRAGGCVDEATLRAMIECLHHRGPDGDHLWVDPARRMGLAHARLSIVDLTPTGNQPMANEDGSLWLVANGEIYNHGELRLTLERAGHAFRSTSDSEVFLHGYEEWGVGLLERIRGMFAVAIAEPETGRVLLARDRIGEKPLVYLEDEHGVAGASQIPALRRSGRVSDAIDPRALTYLMARNMRHVPDPLSIFADVRKLEPGHLMMVQDGVIETRERWWSPTWKHRSSSRRLKTALREAVSLQRSADVEVGALLSGGVDSSIVVGLAAQDRAEPLRTYALGRDLDDPELIRARTASDRFGTRHHEAQFDEAQLSRLDALIAEQGEPVALLPLTHADVLLQRVREDGLRVVLTGNGADELLYGYAGAARLRRLSALMRLADQLPKGLRIRLRGSRYPVAVRLAATELHERKTEIYRREVGEAAELLRPELRARARMPARCPVFSPWSEAFDGRSYSELSQFLTLVVEDAHSVTISADLVGMHSSVEMRSPFLDRDVVDAALGLPAWRKSGPLWRPRGKWVLKRAFGRLISRQVVQAPKMGFGYTLQEDDLIRGPFRDRIVDRLRNGEGIAAVFDRKKVLHRLDEHLAGTRSHGKLILSLYAFEVWHEALLRRPTEAAGRP